MNEASAGRLKTPSRRRVADEVAAILKETIFDKIHGEFRPGTQIREVTTARELGVSRDSLRQALLSLAADGLVVILPHRGAFVAGINAPHVREVYKVRKVLELTAVDNLGTNDDTTIRELEACVDRMRAALASKSFGQLLQADLDFHIQLVASHGSELLNELYGRVSTKLKLCIAIGYLDGGMPNPQFGLLKATEADEVTAHKRLIALLRAREFAKARALLSKTLSEDEALLLQRVPGEDSKI